MSPGYPVGKENLHEDLHGLLETIGKRSNGKGLGGREGMEERREREGGWRLCRR